MIRKSSHLKSKVNVSKEQDEQELNFLKILFKKPVLYIFIMFILSFVYLIYINYYKLPIYSTFNEIIDYSNNLILIIILISITIIISFLFSLFYYFKQKNSKNYFQILISTYVSLIISFAIFSTIILFFGFVIMSKFNFSSDIIIIFLITFISHFAFIFSYLSFKIYLINKLTGSFNFQSFFKFKHFPFSIWNIMSTKNNSIKNSIIKFSTISSFLIFLVIFSIYSILIVGNISDFSEFNTNSLSNGDNLIIPYRTVLEIRNYSNIGFQFFEDISNEKFDLPILKNEGYIYYECDKNLKNCKNKSIETNKIISEIIDISKYQFYIFGNKNQNQDIYLIPKFDINKAYSENVFFVIPEIANTQIGKEINNKFKSLFINNSINIKPINSKIDALYWYYFEDLDGLNQTVREGWNMLANYIDMQMLVYSTYEIYSDLEKNKLYGEKLPYNTLNHEEYKNQLEVNIKELNLMYLKIEDKKLNQEEIRNNCEIKFDEENTKKSIFLNSINNIWQKINYQSSLNYYFIEGCIEFANLDFLKNIHNLGIFSEIDDSKDIYSQIVKLNLEQEYLQSRLVNNCEKKLDCIFDVIEITKDIDLCFYLYDDSQKKDECILNYISNDSETEIYCPHIINNSIYNKCENKFK